MYKIKNVLILLILISICALLMFFSLDAKAGALVGFDMAINIVMPSLFPLLVIFGYIQNSPLVSILTKAFGCITNKVFRLPKAATSAIIFGMIGGYPSGALLTDGLLKSEEISKEEAKRMLRFNVNGGLPFIVTAVGTVIYKSTIIGLILFASTTLSALLIGVISSFFYDKIDYDIGETTSLSFDTALQKSISSSIVSILKITAYIIVFSAISSVVNLPSFLIPFFEITNGIYSKEGWVSLEMIAFFLAFSGFCIHLQLFESIKNANMKYGEFLFFRIAHSVTSFFVAKLLFSLFPQTISVVALGTFNSAEFASVNIALSVVMIAGCFVFVLDVNSKKQKNM